MSKPIKIPDKLYYKLAEVLKLAAIQPYVLKYWETEFPQLSGGKHESGQRIYTRQDLETILRIKKLLYEDGYTISGAKKQMEVESPVPPAEPSSAPPSPAADAVASRPEIEVKYKMVLEGALADLKALLASLQN